MWEQGYGELHVTEADYKEMLKDTNFYNLPVEGYAGSIGAYTLKYGRLIVFPILDKCDTCKHYEAK